VKTAARDFEGHGIGKLLVPLVAAYRSPTPTCVRRDPGRDELLEERISHFARAFRCRNREAHVLVGLQQLEIQKGAAVLFLA
jgi:hypothetical protein